MIHTQTQIDNLIELAIIQRVELKKLVESLPELRTHLSMEIERNLNEIEPAMRDELQKFLSQESQSEHAKLGNVLKQKIAELSVSLEDTTAAKYSVLMAERAENETLLAKAEARIAEAASALPNAVKEIVTDELSRFPRAGEIDQLRKEFAEPKGLNPRGKWESGVTYYKLDLVGYNGDSYVANEETTQKPSRNSTKWTLNSARGAAGSGNSTTLAELTGSPANGQILIGSNGAFVNADITAGDGIAISTAAGFIEISADGGTNYQGTWDAATNNPALTSSVGTKGYYYVVNVDGSTNLNGITDWKVGDWAIYNGSVWQKVDNSESVTSVFGRVGSITAVAGDYSATQITNTAAGSITATTVQDAINELDGEKLAKASNLSDVASVTTSRTNLGVTATGADTTYAYRANNLNDLASVTSARTNLGLGSAALESTTFFLQAANSLNDVASVALARSNLGLGSIATQSAGNVSITGGTITGITDLAIADGGTGASNTTDARTNLGLGSAAVQSATYFLQVANNLSDVASVALARTNLGLGNSATRDVGTTAGTVAAGDDARFTDSRTPTGPAGGDLTGTYPNPSLTISGVTAGGYGSASSAVVITLDSKGRATSASAVNIQIAESQVTNLVTDLASKIPSTEKGANSGVATLDSGGKIPLTQLPDSILGQVTYMGTWNAATNSPTLANPPATTTLGDYYIVTTGGTFASITFNIGDWIISNGADGWAKVDNTDAVASVFGRTGTVTATNGDYTASNITNVPAGNIVATEVQAALNELDGDKLAKASNLSDLVSFSTARTNLGLGSAATQNDTYFLQVANNLSDLASVTTARSNLGLGTMAVQNAASVSITGGSITGITDLAVADGGTGVSTSTGTTNVVLSNSPTIVTPVIAQINDASGNETLKLASVASAVNEISIENGSTGNPVHIRATGSDASVGLHLVAKGASGYVNVTDGVDETKRIMFNAAGGTTNTRTMLSSTQTVDRTLTLPDATGTLLYGGGPLGTPSSGTVTNLTGTASININGTVGATTASTGAFTTLSASGKISSNISTGAQFGVGGASSGQTVGYLHAFDTTTTTLLTFDRSDGAVAGSLIYDGTGLIRFGTTTAHNLELMRGGTTIASVSSTGLAVTGALSSTTGATFATSSGNVGIGTASPAFPLDVNLGLVVRGNATRSGSGMFLANDSTYGLSINAVNHLVAGLPLAIMGYPIKFLSSETGGELARIDTSGNVGIGTTPQTQFSTVKALSIQGTNGSGGQISSGGSQDVVISGNAYLDASAVWQRNATGAAAQMRITNGITSWWNTTGTTGAITFTQAMTLDATGNLLVGTTSGNTHTLLKSADSTPSLIARNGLSSGTLFGITSNFSAAAPNNSTSFFLQCNDTGAERCTIRSNGGIANYQANDVNLSDSREKINFAPAKSYLETICAIPVQTFNYIDQNMEEDGGLTLGVVAQDVQAVAPELVTESNWGSKEDPKMRLSIYQTDFQYALMKSIQELNANLVAQVAALSQRLAALESN
jgi:hypothetical protein